MYRNEEIDFLTEGYESVAQMSVALAYELGYVGHPDYAIVNPRGDETSAGLPYFVDITFDDKHIWYRAYDEKTLITIQQDFQVLVYFKPLIDVPADEEIDMLKQFAAQFVVGGLINQFLTDGLIQWLRDNTDNPDIHTKLCLMKEVANRLDENLTALDTLYKDDFPY
jgi:hypothetical protein